VVIALAGRRIDAADASPAAFPLQNVERVSIAVRALLERQRVTAVVSSAACGADLIGLSEAGRLRLRRRVVLPFGSERFREASVVDRPGDLGELYDAVVTDVQEKGDLVVLDGGESDEAYSAASAAIVVEAIALGLESGEAVAALLVWDGDARAEVDHTHQFGEHARERGLDVLEVLTV
jgi:hypothetical protein